MKGWVQNSLGSGLTLTFDFGFGFNMFSMFQIISGFGFDGFVKNYWDRVGFSGLTVFELKSAKNVHFQRLLHSGFESFSIFGFYLVLVLKFLNSFGSGSSGLEKYFGFGSGFWVSIISLLLFL